MQKELRECVVSGMNYYTVESSIHRTICYIVLAVALVAFMAGTVHTQIPLPAPVTGNVLEIRDMTPGQPIERTARTSDRHFYALMLEAGTSVEFTVGKRDMDLSVSAWGPDNPYYAASGADLPLSGRDIVLVRPFATGSVEPLVVVAEKAGRYVLRIVGSGAGAYSISSTVARATTDRDRKYAEAGSLMWEIGSALGGRRPLSEVRDQIDARIGIFTELGDKKSLALALWRKSDLFQSMYETSTAIEYERQVMELHRSEGRPIDVLNSLSALASMSANMGNYQDAIDYHNQNLVIARSLGKTQEANALFGLGVFYHRLADEAKAREYYVQYYAIQTAIDPPTIKSLNSQNLYFTNMANLARGMNGGEISVDGFPPRTSDDFRMALEYLKQALEINRKMEVLFSSSTGLDTFNLLQIANTHKELGQFSEALEYLDRFAAHPSSNTPRQRARVAVLYGSVYARKGNMGKATEYFDEVVKLLRAGANPGNRLGYLLNIARDYYDAGYLVKSDEVLKEVLEVARADARPMAMAESLFEIARIERDLGNFNNARKNVEEAIRIAEEIRARINTDELRTTYFSSVRRFYEFYIDLLMQAHKAQPEKAFDRLALETSEKARSRNLLDLLTVSGVDIKQGVDHSLVARERLLRQQLSEKATQKTRLLMTKHTDAEAAKIKQVVADLSSQYDGVQSEIRAKSPNYAALTQPAALSSLQIQKLLDSGTVLLEYSLGEKKSYLWAVGVDSIESFDLPKKADLEARARRVYELATARNRQIKGESVESRSLRVKKADAEYAIASASLSEALLGPAANLIRNKRLLIVPDGALNYISFAALPGIGRQESAVVASDVIGQDHEVVTLPSASVLGRLRSDSASRKAPSKLLAVFADPVFSKADSRAKVAGALPGKKAEPIGFALTRDFERALEGSGLGAESSAGLPRLPFSRREADSIFNASAKDLSLKHLDFAANKQAVFDGGLDQYRIIHFATHGLLDSQNPGLSGMVLSLVDKNGADVDGFLRLQDVYNLKLNADLVVLSACNTALGKEVKGEGLIGLTRGFMYAGSPRVVASLWKVDDAATAAFMTIFYRKMLAENLRPAAALRAAQLEMMKQPRWRSPYYWAPFVLQGEWK